MWSKFLIFLFIPITIFAHSGRLDGNGGHRVNKKYVYEGKFLEVRQGKVFALESKVVFDVGDYHYHIHPRYTDYADGIYLAVGQKDIKDTVTENVYNSLENVIASVNGDVYHNPWSYHIRNIKEENIIIFTDYEEAEASGYKPAKRFVKYVPGTTELTDKQLNNLEKNGFSVGGEDDE